MSKGRKRAITAQKTKEETKGERGQKKRRRKGRNNHLDSGGKVCKIRS
jgi:hypothetical protein